MRKVCKLLLILVICNFIFTSFFNFSVASSDFSKDDYESITQNGTATVETDSGESTKKIDLKDSTVGSSTGQLASTLATPVASLDEFLAKVAIGGGIYHEESDYSASKTGLLTISSLVFGEFLIFDGKFYRTTESLNPAIPPTGIVKTVDTIKNVGSGFFVVFRTISLAISIPLLIYALAKALNAATAKDLALWKKVIGRWFISVVLIFTIKYIFIAMHAANDFFMNIFWNIRLSIESSGNAAFEIELFKAMANKTINTGGNLSLAYTIEYVLLVFLQVLFVIKYTKRALLMIFMGIVSPIVIMVNAFNLMTGKEGSILKDYMVQYASLLYIQLVHTLFYLIFLFSASEIAARVPIVGLLFLYALYRAEMLAKVLLNMNEQISLKE